jgi:acyl carrier protein
LTEVRIPSSTRFTRRSELLKAIDVKSDDSIFEARIAQLVLEYAQTPPGTPGLALDPALSLRRELSIDSLSLVSLALRLGEELAVDLVELGLDLSRLETVGDLIALGRSLKDKGEDQHGRPSAASRG